ELSSPGSASSRPFALLLRPEPRQRPTSGKSANRPVEYTTPLTCSPTRSTDGLQCEGTWACGRGRIERPVEAVTGAKRNHTFPCRQHCRQSNFCPWLGGAVVARKAR